MKNSILWIPKDGGRPMIIIMPKYALSEEELAAEINKESGEMKALLGKYGNGKAYPMSKVIKVEVQRKTKKD